LDRDFLCWRDLSLKYEAQNRKKCLLSKDLKVFFGDFDLPMDQELGVFKEKEVSGWAYGVVKDGAEEPW